QGAEVIEFPSIRVAPLDDYAAVDRAIERLGEYRWLVFTSQNGVAAFVDRLRASGRGVAELGRVRLGAIGPATAHALERHGHPPAVSPDRFVAEALVEAMAREDLRGARVLLPRALDARAVLPDGVRARRWGRGRCLYDSRPGGRAERSGGAQGPRERRAMTFPLHRLRRLRRTDVLRGMVRETTLEPRHLVAPLFLKEGLTRPAEL